MLNVYQTMKYSFQRTSMSSNNYLLKRLNFKTVYFSLNRNVPKRLGGIGRRQQLYRETEQLVGGQCLYDPRDDTGFLSFCEKLGASVDIIREIHGTIDNCSSNEIVGPEEILDKPILISNATEKRDCNELLKVSILYWRNKESTLHTHPTVENMAHFNTKMVTRKLEEDGFLRDELQQKEIKLIYT